MDSHALLTTEKNISVRDVSTSFVKRPFESNKVKTKFTQCSLQLKDKNRGFLNLIKICS